MRMAALRMRISGVQIEVGEDNQLADDLRVLGFPKAALMAQSVGHLECTFGLPEVVTL